MNREIEFRGKCVSDSKYAGEWVTGGYVAPNADCKNQSEGLIVKYFGGNTTITYHVDPYTVGQFTGLRDENGVKIFEGDIVNVCFNEYDRVGRFYACTDLKPYYRGVVTWNDRLGKYEILIEKNSQFDGNSHIVSCEIGWGHEEFMVVGKYIDDPFPLQRDEP